MLTEKESEWCKLLNQLYGNEGVLSAKQFSVWWKDLNGIDAETSLLQGWFSSSVKLKLGAGSQVSFWHDCWCGPWKFV